jgi:hypothetical protein
VTTSGEPSGSQIFAIGFGGLFGARRQNGEVNDAEANQIGRIQHPPIHEKIAQIFAHVADRRRVGRSEIYQ